jgi:hypothetical protein
MLNLLHTTRNSIRWAFAAILAATALSACSAASQPLANREGATGGLPAPAPAQAPGAKSETRDEASTGASDVSQVAARLIVRNASLTLIVQDTQAQLDVIAGLASRLNGYIASSSTQKYEQGLQARLTLRVPSDKLDEAMAELRKLAVEVREEQITGEDVTAEYTDLTSRMKNLEAAEAQLRDILSKAEKTEDVLSVFNQLTQIRGEIEQTKGRMQYLSQSASLATINVTLIPDALAQPLTVAGWRPEGVVKSAVEALITALQGLATLTIWLVIVVLPIALIISSPFIVLIALIRRRNNRRKQQLASKS